MSRRLGIRWLCVLISMAVHMDSVAQESSKTLTIAIVDFANATGRADYEYLSRALSENIITALARAQSIQVVERSRMDAALREMTLGAAGFLDESTAAQLGHAVGADGIIIGSYTAVGDLVRINARFVDVQTTTVTMAKQVTGSNLMTLMDEIAELLLIELTPDEAEREVLWRERARRQDSFESQFKNPVIASSSGLLLPILGHSYVGGRANIVRGMVYTAGSAAGVTAGILFEDAGGFWVAAGVHLISAIDAGFSADSHNKRLRKDALALRITPTSRGGVSFAVSLAL